MSTKWFERYTRSSYKRKEVLNKAQLKYIKQIEEDDPSYQERIMVEDMPIDLSHADSIKIAHCYTCDKVFENNYRRYCYGCAYFFNPYDYIKRSE